MIDYEWLANELINSMLHIIGLTETIDFLLDCRVSKEQLVEEFNFDRNDVERVMQNRK